MNTPKPNIFRRFVTAAALWLLAVPALLGQGNLTPPGTPAPTMKSLQEIWEKVGVLETTVTEQRAQITEIKQQNILLLESHGVSFPFQLTIADSAGNVGEHTALAFTPGGQPAISYHDRTNGDLKYAVTAPFTNP